jgi:hypothetical protein
LLALSCSGNPVNPSPFFPIAPVTQKGDLPGPEKIKSVDHHILSYESM